MTATLNNAAAARSGFAIETEALTRTFGDLMAVDHLDCRVPYGQIFGLLGPNGAGKSTTIKMLTTLLDPTSGSARVAGFDIVAAPAQVRRSIGYVPQMLSADGGLTGEENLLLSAKRYAIPRIERKPRERFMGIGQVLTLPLFFASNAIYPIAIMPGWLKVVALVNPLTYLVDALRGQMIVGGESVHGYASDFGIMTVIFIVLSAIAARLYPTLLR